ncbi:MAG: NADPH-dependent oxidoreductase [Planctomycetota bacterium]|nr:MAG: NADPH-dependent oxidoreductase [Planctomycetota bacterium]
MKRSLAILGSARSDGNTAGALARLVHDLPCDVVDLAALELAPFSYVRDYRDDDPFLPLVERIVEAPLTILATPVYWYSYSTSMKTFVDRFTDLLFWHKPLGRRLRGCAFALLSTGSGPEPAALLNETFDSFCGYLGIRNLGTIYAAENGPFHPDSPVERIRAYIRQNAGAS